MKKWNVGVYLRLSSDDGDKSESNSIGNQRSLIKRYITNEKELKIIDYYIDDGYSGTTFNRPDFERMMKDIKANKIEISLKDIKEDEYWIEHFRRNKKIKSLTREVIEDLIECIYVHEGGNLTIKFKYQDEYERLVNAVNNELEVAI